MPIFDEEHRPPDATEADATHAVVDTAVSLIPGLGPIAARLFGHIFTPPLERRKREWMEDVAGALRRLEERTSIPLDSLGENEAFIDTVFQATQAAMRTSQRDKRRALRNVVLNAALPHAPDVAIQHMFVNLLDEFTDWHLLVLTLLRDPTTWRAPDGRGLEFPSWGGLALVLFRAYTDLGSAGLADQVWSDLHARGLITTQSPHGTMTENGLRAKRTTDLGDRFLAFIKEPG